MKILHQSRQNHEVFVIVGLPTHLHFFNCGFRSIFICWLADDFLCVSQVMRRPALPLCAKLSPNEIRSVICFVS